MNEPSLIHIEEPRLTFAHGQKVQDPRDGLTLFGPFSKGKHVTQINVGIIGPEKQRGFIKEYLQKIHKPVLNPAPDLARPYFPGLEAAFDISVNFNSLEEIDVHIDSIKEFLNYTDGHQRIFHLTNLYSTRLTKYYNEEHLPISVWFVAIPNEVYLYGRPKSRIPSDGTNITTHLSRYEKNSSVIMLFDDLNKQKEAYDFEVNFHNQLKAKLLAEKVVTQIVREDTVAYDKIWTDPEKVEYERQFDTDKAWNICTTLYYKSGGIPWKLGEVRKKVCYLGLVYKQMDLNSDIRNACCAAQMFLDSGDGMVFRGNIGPWFNPETKEFHIKKNAAMELLTMSIESFKHKSATNSYPEQIFIHAKTYFDDEEWEGFLEAAEGKCEIIGIRIRENNNFKLYRDFSYCVPRGSTLVVSETFAYLWTNGYIPRIQTQKGLETPNPLHVEIIRGSENIQTVCRDILALTKLNYNACIFSDGSPVTLKFADSIGEVLTAGKAVKSDVLPFKHYV
ncbi:MAG TPA: hypothetical protein VGD40_24205 [Chryseosolibacter sp.]